MFGFTLIRTARLDHPEGLEQNWDELVDQLDELEGRVRLLKDELTRAVEAMDRTAGALARSDELRRECQEQLDEQRREVTVLIRHHEADFAIREELKAKLQREKTAVDNLAGFIGSMRRQRDEVRAKLISSIKTADALMNFIRRDDPILVPPEVADLEESRRRECGYTHPDPSSIQA